MKKILYFLFLTLVLIACSTQEPTAQKQLPVTPAIFPDYTFVTIPRNIAPLRFKLTQETAEAVAVLTAGEKKLIQQAEDGKFLFPEKAWKDLLQTATEITVQVYEKQQGQWAAYQPFTLQIAPEEIDSHLAYRLIPPGYEPWYKLGIYQRDLTTYEEKAILENSQTDNNCMNCHSFCMQDPQKMVFHMRAVYGGTYLVNGQNVEKLDGKVDDEIPSLVYPSWHPNGNYIAFSSNSTMQVFLRNDSNRIEVYDKASNVLVYDVNRHKVLTCEQLFSPQALETFPTFSPDGKTLYFCSAQMTNSLQLPRDYKQIKYNLCSISFDAPSGTFGTQVDTLYSVKQEGRSAKFPRVSPDGKHLVFTVSDFGNFSIWHHDADLYSYDVEKGTYRPLNEANSTDTESYHSWSSNSRWMVLSSRRQNGLYTHPYFTYIDANGQASKPFLLPQSDPDFYTDFLFSYNIPELIKGEVPVDTETLVHSAKNDIGTKITR